MPLTLQVQNVNLNLAEHDIRHAKAAQQLLLDCLPSSKIIHWIKGR